MQETLISLEKVVIVYFFIYDNAYYIQNSCEGFHL